MAISLFLKTKDYSVSRETFELRYDADWDMLITWPQPKDLGAYYESDTYISHTDAKSTFSEKLYQKAKKINLRQKINTIRKLGYFRGTLLDIGAGTGDFLALAQRQGFGVSGVEPNAKARALAAKKGISLHRELSHLPPKKFDIITLWHVLEHLPDLREQLARITALLQDNGLLLVAVPNYKSYDARYYGPYWAGYDVPRHLWHFSKTAVAKLFHPHQMQITSIRPMLLDAFYVAMLSETYKNRKAVLFRAFCVGLVSNLRACFTKEYSSLLYGIQKTV